MLNRFNELVLRFKFRQLFLDLDALAACACLIEPVLRFNFRQLLIDRMRLPFFNFAYGTFALAAR